MSYPQGIDEIPMDDLVKEIERRMDLSAEGLCDYCGGAADTYACRFPERHEASKVNMRDYRAGRRISDKLREFLFARSLNQ